MARKYSLEYSRPKLGAKKCESINRKSKYVKKGVPIGLVCQRDDKSWGYHFVGGAPNTLYGRHRTKTAAIKRAIKDYKLWIG